MEKFTRIQSLFCQLLHNPIPVGLIVEQYSDLSPTDWKAFFTLTMLHKLTPIIYQRLQHIAKDIAIPDDIQQQMHLAYLKTSGRNLRILTQTGKILQVFKDEDIEVMGLKGVFLLENIYTNIALRSLGDIDLLIKRRDLAKAITLLEVLNYRATKFFDPDEVNPDMQHAPIMTDPNGLAVELHWTISRENYPFIIDIDDLWQRSIPATIADVEVRALSLEDLLMHLCIHLSYHHCLKNGLRELFDIREVVQNRQDQINWHELAVLADNCQAERVIALTFKLLDDVLGFKIPVSPDTVHFFEMADPAIVHQALDMLFQQSPGTATIKSLDVIRLSKTRGVSAKMKLIISRIFLPKAQMGRLYDISPNTLQIYFYYPIRIFQLLYQYSGAAVRLLIKTSRGHKIDPSLEALLEQQEEIQSLRDWMTSA